MNSIVKKETLSKEDKKLYDELAKIENNDEFIDYTFLKFKKSEQRRELYEFIKNTPNLTAGKIALYTTMRIKGEDVNYIEKCFKETWI